MKKIGYILILIIITACDKFPINGKLDGMWQLKEIEYKDGTNEVPEAVYYSFQLHLMKLTQVHKGSLYGNKSENYLGRFNHTEDSLIVYDFRIYRDEETSVSAEQLIPFGIKGTSGRFKIEKLSKSKMILQSYYTRLTFRKF